MARHGELSAAADRLTYGWEPIRVLLDEPNVRALILSYWEELSPLKTTAPLDPDFARMVLLEDNNLFRVWAARDEGLLVGFIMFHLMPHLNYRNTLFATDAGHYLDPLIRDTSDWIGVRMWRSALAALPDLGVKVVLAHDNASRPLGPFFRRLGFEPRSTMYWRAL